MSLIYSTEKLIVLKDDLVSLLYTMWDILKKGFHQDNKDVTFKSSKNDLLTQYDIEINTKIVKYLEKNYPTISIISEEEDPIPKDSQYSFLVDPIDWTRNFVRWIPMTFIWIWLAFWKETILSVTYNPITDEMFHAIKDNGAYCNKSKISISERTLELSDLCIRALPNKKLERIIVSKMIENVHQVKNNMCSHEEISWTACNKYDGFISQGSSPWDYCHYLLVTEAWWKVTDWKWEEFNISKNNIILSNWIIHQELLNAVRNER